MSRQAFFDYVRNKLFGGTLTSEQVDGMSRILDYRNNVWPAMPDEELAYVLATVKWETAHKMQPVKEMGGEAYLRSKKYYPYYGRGLVQITWKDNYAKFGIKNPDDALKWDVSLDVLFRGMIFGMFTGKSLSDYITGTKIDYLNARRIINGTDKAQEIAKIADHFRRALADAARAEPDIPDVPDSEPSMPEPSPEPETPPLHGSMSQSDFNVMLHVALADPVIRQSLAHIIAEKLDG